MKKQEVVEQTDNSVSKIGKFGSAEELLSAYNALESEFTKRCQLVKQLQAQLAAFAAQAEQTAEMPPSADDDPDPNDKSARHDDPDPTVRAAAADDPAQANGDVDREVPCDGVPEAQTIVSTDPAVVEMTNEIIARAIGEIERDASAYVDALCAIPEIMDGCIERYKRRIVETRVSAPPSGCAVIAPLARPRTLSEAKILADKLIGQ